MVNIQPLSQGAIERAALADPNGQRCLIENCSKNRAVVPTHLLDRILSADSAFMSAVEWSLGMTKGTLRLDTRRNIFFVGASIRELYQQKRFAILPEESIIYKFLDMDGRPLERENMPIIEDTVFKYTFIPIDLREVFITRQNEDNVTVPIDPKGITFHFHPFDGLPVVKSHVDPRFAILQIGNIFKERSDLAWLAELKVKYPILEKVVEIHAQWTREVPERANADTTYVGEGEQDEETLSEYDDSDGDSVTTAPRRLRDLGSLLPPPSLGQTVMRPKVSTCSVAVQTDSPVESDEDDTEEEEEAQFTDGEDEEGSDSESEYSTDLGTPPRRIGIVEYTTAQLLELDDDEEEEGEESGSDLGATPPGRIRVLRVLSASDDGSDDDGGSDICATPPGRIQVLRDDDSDEEGSSAYSATPPRRMLAARRGEVENVSVQVGWNWQEEEMRDSDDEEEEEEEAVVPSKRIADEEIDDPEEVPETKRRRLA
ncbi:hypothetical protein CVT24_008521 [Panaeolus cyanescens]|uniref:HNH nuclease domain-containing protein n=1 Tax=Panaeolus cyanescens TaxID=181874 RepID=A0A409VL13_9AGAR|nr:hypothetical protein CVT24_008521 [Panaeolus cyanescens]